MFQKVGSKELRFLVNSGAIVGLGLGFCQAAVSLCLPRCFGGAGENITAEPERRIVSLLGSGAVGCITNWIALLWIFRPINPVRILGFTVHGCFLRRQPEVSRDFAAFFLTKVLTARKMLNDALFNGPRAHFFRPHLRARVAFFLRACSRELPVPLRGLARDGALVDAATTQITRQLPSFLPDALFVCADEAFDLENTLATQMARMPSRDFERLLHPIFEEDELTLIAVGGILGIAAAWAQLALGDRFSIIAKTRLLKLKPANDRANRKLGSPLCVGPD